MGCGVWASFIQSPIGGAAAEKTNDQLLSSHRLFLFVRVGNSAFVAITLTEAILFLTGKIEIWQRKHDSIMVKCSENKIDWIFFCPS